MVRFVGLAVRPYYRTILVWYEYVARVLDGHPYDEYKYVPVWYEYWYAYM